MQALGASRDALGILSVVLAVLAAFIYILQTMRAREVAVDVQPWSRRFRVYTEMIKSGSPVEIAKVLRDMNRLKFDKDLSFGERRLLDQARSLLLKELALAKKKTEADMADEIKRIFST